MQDVTLDVADHSLYSKDRPLLMPSPAESDALVEKDAGWTPLSLAIVALAAVAVLVALFFAGDELLRAATIIFELMNRDPALGFLAFIAMYTFNALLCLPVFPLILGIGFVSVRINGVFPGIPLGCLQVLAAAIVAGTVVYVVGRNACRSQVSRLARRSTIVHVEEVLMQHKGLQIVSLMRMTSFLPFGASSYALSATSVRFRDYFLGTILGLAPFIIVEVSAGASLSSLSYVMAATSSLNAPVEEHVSKLQYFLFGFSLCLAVFSSWYISRLARAELALMRARHEAGDQARKTPDLAAYKSFVEDEFSHQPEPVL